ncbi:MAG: ribonuclease H family protein [Bacteroidaceae bacterium]|nr:ribonuclease H family protein [Bacteroidaceae bacterium]
MAKKSKYYVVWHGVEPGIYETWRECERQVKGFDGAVYKSFESRAEAEEAYHSPAHLYVKRRVAAPTSEAAAPVSPKAVAAPPEYRRDTVLPLPLCVRADALAVDAACSGNPGPMEYRGVYLATGQEIFHYGPVHGTNNIGEFLAIVHALALIEQRGAKLAVYSDSRNALLWVKKKQCRTKLERTPQTEELFRLIERAEHWLRTHTYDTPLLKWETKEWGEVPADFGRK